MRILGRTLRFGDAEPADIVIFDETNSQYIRKVLNKKYRVSVFKVRPEEIRVGYNVILYFIKFLSDLKLEEMLNNKRGIAVGFLSQCKNIYFKACLVAQKPKVVVTSIDNSPIYWWLSKNCKEFPFIAIQNGFRLSYAAQEVDGFYLQHYFCFGKHEKELFPKLALEVNNYYSVGSLLASLYFNTSKNIGDRKYDLLIVSSWRGNIGFTQDVKDTMSSMKIMDQLLAYYIKSKGISAAIILRAERNSEHWMVPEVGLNEEEYYREIYGGNVEIIEADFTKRNIYPLMQASDLIVSCLSTALLEVYGIGKKILFCNFTGTDRYHQDFDESIVTVVSDTELFSEKLDSLRNMPEASYAEIHNKNQKHYMNYPDNLLTYTAILEKVDTIIIDFK